MPRSAVTVARTRMVNARSAVNPNGYLKPTPAGMVDRQEQPDGDYGNNSNIKGWMCNVTWKQLQPDFQGQALQGSKTAITYLTTALTKNDFNPTLRTLQVQAVNLGSVPSSLMPQGLIFNDGYAVVQLDDGAGHTHVITINGNINPGDTSIKVNDCLPNFSYPVGTTVWFLSGTAWIDEAMKWANAGLAQGRFVDLIPFMGDNAPNWAKQIQRTTPVFLTDGVTPGVPIYQFNSGGSGVGQVGTMGAVDDANYRVACKDLYTKLGARYDSNPGLGVIRACSAPGGIFMEPVVRLVGDTSKPGNVNAATCTSYGYGGFTAATDVTMQQNYMDDCLATFPTTPALYSYDAYGELTQSQGPFSVGSVSSTTIVFPYGGTFPTSGWSNTNSAAWFHLYAGRVAFGSPVTGGSTIQDAQTSLGTVLSTIRGLLPTTVLYIKIAEQYIQINNSGVDNSGISTGGLITLASSLATAVSNAPNGDLQGFPYWITPFQDADSGHNNAYAINSVTQAGGAGTNVTVNITGFTAAAVPSGTLVSLAQVNNSKESTAVTLMTAMRSKGGGRAMIGLNSVDAGNPLSRTAINDLVATGGPYYYQTRSDTTVNSTLLGVLNAGTVAYANCLEVGARFIENQKGYIQSTNFVQNTTSARNSISIKNSGLGAFTTSNWGTNRWSKGPGLYGLVILSSGNIYLVCANTGNTIKVHGIGITDATRQGSAALTTALTSGNTVASLACTGTFPLATTSGDIVMVIDSATGNTQAFTSGGSAINATSITITGMPLGSGSAANANYPTATTKIFYCPLATNDDLNNGTGTVYGYVFQSTSAALALSTACRLSGGTNFRSPLLANRTSVV